MTNSKNLLTRLGIPKQVASVAIERKRFGEITHGNQIDLTVDGEETFKLIYDAIFQAESSIFIAGYDLDPSLNFVRDNDYDLPKTSKSSASSGSVVTDVEQFGKDQSHTSSSSAASTGQNSLSTVADCTTSRQRVKGRHSYKRFQELIIEKARNGATVRIIVWQPRLPLRILPGADERGLDGRAEEVEVLNKLAIKYGIEQNLIVKIDNTSPTLSSAHHEKIIVIDSKIGFCGGFDLSRGKWDTSRHHYNDSQRDQDSEPWHDCHAIMRGPIVWDLAYHFNQRWAYHEVKDEKRIRALNLKPANFPFDVSKGGTKMVALRTWEGMDKDGGILAWYTNSIRKAKNSIYIENQFPFQNEFITRILCKRLQEQKNLKVIIVGPMEPNLPGLIGSILSKTSVNDVNKHLQWIRDAGDLGRRVGTYSLVCQDKKTKSLRQIYVHSKLFIVDDKWITIGSANIDKNGFKDSTEVNVGITSSSLAKELRIRLWREHIGSPENTKNLTNIYRPEKAKQLSPSRRKFESPSYDNCSDIEDFDNGFNIWKKIADQNGLTFSNKGNITGHIYYYNFEEMNLPPPYPEAKGGSKFSFL
ncbi:MAG: phosphatidylserine/phosphatidylglycerophosphate/cardiolipin synthase family protein [Nitrososphaeraceae archaeon]